MLRRAFEKFAYMTSYASPNDYIKNVLFEKKVKPKKIVEFKVVKQLLAIPDFFFLTFDIRTFHPSH